MDLVGSFAHLNFPVSFSKDFLVRIGISFLERKNLFQKVSKGHGFSQDSSSPIMTR